jgi:DNA polymerase V
MNNTSLALVDINNMYCSCERIFQPQLKRQGVVVVGSNDGNIIARSEEVKALGIPMGAPVFAYEALIKQHQIAVLSSNWALY